MFLKYKYRVEQKKSCLLGTFSIISNESYGGIAQLGERYAGSVKVIGSIPFASTKFLKAITAHSNYQNLTNYNHWNVVSVTYIVFLLEIFLGISSTFLSLLLDATFCAIDVALPKNVALFCSTQLLKCSHSLIFRQLAYTGTTKN